MYTEFLAISSLSHAISPRIDVSICLIADQCKSFVVQNEHPIFGIFEGLAVESVQEEVLGVVQQALKTQEILLLGDCREHPNH
jgi:hypothetical protein